MLRDDFDPVAMGEARPSGGRAAMSVLTDEQLFSRESGRSGIGACGQWGPARLLRKDFTIDALPRPQAAAHGADAILLIAAILTERQMREFRELAESYHMAALVEVHDEGGTETCPRVRCAHHRSEQSESAYVPGGVEVSLRLADRIPASILKVTESGIHGARRRRATPHRGLPGVSGRRASGEVGRPRNGAAS